MEAFRLALHEIIAAETGLPAAGIGPSDPLISVGLLDSFGMLSVLALVEEHLGAEVPPELLTLENFDSVDRIMGLVSGHAAAGPGL